MSQESGVTSQKSRVRSQENGFANQHLMSQDRGKAILWTCGPRVDIGDWPRGYYDVMIAWLKKREIAR